MILIYAYINKFKNYTTQEIIFDPRWQINFSNEKLSIQYRGQSSASAVIRGDRKPDNLHILVGKTGSGKTNLLQMIGAKHDVRYHRKWEGEDDSYFLLYSISDTEFFLEICDMEIMQFQGECEACGDAADGAFCAGKSVEAGRDGGQILRGKRIWIRKKSSGIKGPRHGDDHELL